MADNQPAPAPAPEPAAPQGTAPDPVAPAADGTPAPQAIDFNSFNDEEKTYLAAQGVTKQEELTTESLRKVINHSQASQKSASAASAELDRIKKTINPASAPVNPFAVPGTPTDPAPTPDPVPPASTPATPTPSPATPALDPLAAYNLANNLAQNFPELKEDLQSGKFYQDMQALQIPLTDANGVVNIQGVLAYGKIAQTQKQADLKLAELNKPNENNIPDANPVTPAQPAADAPMTRQMALAIMTQDSSHARFAEAKKFMDDNVAKPAA